MSSQVVSQPKNPFVGKNDTDNNTLSINSAVVMLSLTNGTGAPLELGEFKMEISKEQYCLYDDREQFCSEDEIEKAAVYTVFESCQSFYKSYLYLESRNWHHFDR